MIENVVRSTMHVTFTQLNLFVRVQWSTSRFKVAENLRSFGLFLEKLMG